MKQISSFSALLCTGLFALAACDAFAPPPATPPTTGTDTTKTITATVTKTGPPRWSYSVSTSGSGNITKIEMPNSTGGACAIENAPTGWATSAPVGGVVTSSAVGQITVTFDVVCEQGTNSTSNMTVTAGGTKFTVGPIAGPA